MMRELSQKEYFDAFGTTSANQLRVIAECWNHISDEKITVINRRATGQPMINRGQLPSQLEAVLVANEDAGMRYTNTIIRLDAKK